MKIKQQWLARGFQIGHQKVFVDIDFAAESLEGWTELTIIPLTAALDSAALHCWQSEITHCEVEGQGAVWQHVDGLPALRLREDSATVHHHEALRAKFAALNRTIDRCDLQIKFPRDVRVVVQDRDTGQTTHNMQNAGANEDGNEEEMEVATPAVMPTPMTPHGQSASLQISQAHYRPITVKIWFRCTKPDLGVRFLEIMGADTSSVFYTVNHPVPCSTSLWLPCLDGIWERSTWEISVSIPRTLSAIHRRRNNLEIKPQGALNKTRIAANLDAQDSEMLDADESPEMTVICSADFVEETIDPEDDSRKVMTFAQGSPVGASHMAFSVGPFVSHNLSEFREAEEEDLMGSSAVDVVIHCLPDQLEDAKTTCFPMYKAMDFFVKDYGSFPYSTYQMVFLDDMEVNSIAAAGLGFFTTRYLYSETMIEPIFSTTKALTVELASQWVGVNIVPSSWSDTWLILGLAHYLSGLFLKKLMGNNEYRYRLKQDIVQITERDIGMPPLSARSLEIPIDPLQTEFIALKAPVVLHMLEQRLIRAGTNLGLGRVVPKIFLQALSGELSNGLLTTAKFLRQCERQAHVKLDDFARQWIYGHGYPRFSIAQRSHQKKSVIEMAVRQQQFQDDTRAPLVEESFVDDAFRSMTKPAIGQVEAVFTGSLTIRIHESDGTPYEHLIDLKEQSHRFEISYNTKNKTRGRGRKSTKSKLNGDSLDEAGAMRLDEEDLSSRDQIQCLGDGYQGETDRARWRLQDWSAEDEEKMTEDSFEWIRIDPNMEWICTIQTSQADHMFQSQLQQDRDVVAQFEAVQFFSTAKPSAEIATILFRTIMDDRYFYGIRQTAALALAQAATEELDYLGQYQLLGIFRTLFCYDDDAKVIPRSNDFRDIARYLLRKSLLKALVGIRERGYTVPVVRSVLLDQLKHNDNTGNIYDDTHYVCLIIECLVSSLIHSDPSHTPNLSRDRQIRESVDDVLTELERFQRLDRWQPSFQNKITCAIIEGKERLMQSGLVKTSYKEFMSYTRESHFPTVRHQAFRAMLNLGALREAPLARYLLFVQEQDRSAFTKHQFSILLKQGVGAMALRGKRSKYTTHHDTDAMIIEEDTTAAVELRKDRESRSTLEGALTILREEFQDDESLKNHLWHATNNSHSALLVRRNLLDICKVMYEVRESRILKFKLPSMKARWQCTHEGNGKISIRRTRPLDRYQKREAVKPVKIKLKLTNSGRKREDE